MDRKHLEVVAAILIDDCKIFIARRKGNDEFANLFEFPGGKIEKGETHLEALKRELNEELSLEIEKEKYYKTIEHSYTNFDISLHLYICKPKTKQMTLHVHGLGKWVTLEELKEQWNLFVGADHDVIKQIKEGDLRYD